MSEKIKVKIPKISPELLKNNLLIVVFAAAVLFLVLNVLVWLSGQAVVKQTVEIKQKKEKIVQVAKKLKKTIENKPHLKAEEFARKIPFQAIPPIAAIQQAGLIISSIGAQGEIVASEGSAGAASGGSGSGSQGTSSQDIGELILVGSKSLSQQQFSFQFDSDYEDLMKILEKIPSADPLMLVSGFVIERIDKDDVGEPIPGTPFVTIPLVSGDVRKLDIELKLITFTEVSPDEPIWSSGKK